MNNWNLKLSSQSQNRWYFMFILFGMGAAGAMTVVLYLHYRYHLYVASIFAVYGWIMLGALLAFIGWSGFNQKSAKDK